jgi:histidyl-tRNA synthetase
MFEDVGVFVRGIGEESDVAKKEMYVFEDRGERRLRAAPRGHRVGRARLRPAPTDDAVEGVVRDAGLSLRTSPGRALPPAPPTRRRSPRDRRPGRRRRGHRLAERFYRALGLSVSACSSTPWATTSVAPPTSNCCARTWRRTVDELCDEHRRPGRENPLRVLDCKPGVHRGDRRKGPMLIDHICDDCRAHFDKVVAGLAVDRHRDGLGPATGSRLRLLHRTTFEFVADALGGAQNAIGGGGRYDKLAEQLGGKPTSGIGFGSGIERLLLAREAEGVEPRNLVIARWTSSWSTRRASDVATVLVEELRAGFRDRSRLRQPLDEGPDEGGRQVRRAPGAAGRAQEPRPARLRLGTCEVRTSSRRSAAWPAVRSSRVIAELLTK